MPKNRVTPRTSAQPRRQPTSPAIQRWWWVVAVSALIAALLLVNVIRGRGSEQSQPPVAAPTGVVTVPEANRHHVEGHIAYDRTPPAGGDHNPVWLNCGIYDQAVANENAVHSLEHGAVWITYQPSLPPNEVTNLRTLIAAHYSGDERYVILSPYPGLPSPIVATAWGLQLSLTNPADQRLAQFIDHYRLGPQDLEPGAACSGGTGTPIG